MASHDSRQRGLDNLLAGARRRARAALGSWVERDYDGAASSVSEAVELIAKAALWNVNPVLLVPLEHKHEVALIALATDPSLDSPALRTIGLPVALSRLERLRGGLPVPAVRCKRIVDCRNGGLHVGTLPDNGAESAEQVARHVLTDCLTLCDAFLTSLEVTRAGFYEHLVEVADSLVARGATEVDHSVARLLAKAADRWQVWSSTFDDEQRAEDAAIEIASAAAEQVDPTDYGFEVGRIDDHCPACGHTGSLLGRVDVDPDVDVEWEDGGYTYYGRWIITFFPNRFICHVCKLDLPSSAHLEVAGISVDTREVAEADLGNDFDAARWHDDLYNPGR